MDETLWINGKNCEGLVCSTGEAVCVLGTEGRVVLAVEGVWEEKVSTGSEVGVEEVGRGGGSRADR